MSANQRDSLTVRRERARHAARAAQAARDDQRRKDRKAAKVARELEARRLVLAKRRRLT